MATVGFVAALVLGGTAAHEIEERNAIVEECRGLRRAQPKSAPAPTPRQGAGLNSACAWPSAARAAARTCRDWQPAGFRPLAGRFGRSSRIGRVRASRPPSEEFDRVFV
jgi:hypothetical protein